MDKAERLKMLKERGRLLDEKDARLAGGIPFTKQDIQDEMKDMDAFREKEKDSVKIINSDER